MENAMINPIAQGVAVNIKEVELALDFGLRKLNFGLSDPSDGAYRMGERSILLDRLAWSMEWISMNTDTAYARLK